MPRVTGAASSPELSSTLVVPGLPVRISYTVTGAGRGVRCTPVTARLADARRQRRDAARLRDRELARALWRPQESLRYHVDSSGRPALREPPDGPDFSITHTAGLVAVATVDAPLRVGIDAEARREVDLVRVRRAYSEVEWAGILAADDPGAAALCRWSRKEALLKATGVGLSVPPARVPSDGAADGPAALVRPPRDVDPHGRVWAVWSTVAIDGYVLSCAVTVPARSSRDRYTSSVIST